MTAAAGPKETPCTSGVAGTDVSCSNAPPSVHSTSPPERSLRLRSRHWFMASR